MVKCDTMIALKTVFCILFISIISCEKLGTIKPRTSTVVTAFQPKGLMVGIDVDFDAKFIFFDGVLYDKVDDIAFTGESVRQIWGPATRNKFGLWLFEDHNVTLKVGQAVKYDIFVSDGNPIGSRRGEGMSLRFDGDILLSKVFVVTVTEHRSICRETPTKVLGKRACAEQVIFQDDFETFREDLWQIEQYIPIDHPEYPFVSYQKLKVDPNVFAQNGSLHIVPKLQEDLLSTKNESIITGSLDLTNGCTRRQCFKKALGADILPPIVSGRLTSNGFAFTYGTVTVRAKLPQGDWLYPEILLEPLFNKNDYRGRKSSILKIAMADGNREFANSTAGNKVLRRNPMIIDDSCAVKSSDHTKTHGFWSDDFHEYTLDWTPEYITLSVDGFTYFQQHLTNMESSFRCPETGIPVSTPFHDYFYITLGVAAGGISAFPDSLVTGNGKAKPWSNSNPKASLRFWQDRKSWLPTWTQPGLVVDYIKVFAL